MDTETKGRLSSGQEDLALSDPDPLTVHSNKEALSREECWKLIQQARSGNDGAFKKLLGAYMFRINRTARLFMISGATKFVPLDEMVQEGIIGLWSSVKRYEMKNGSSFDTYASRRIHGAMLDALRKNSDASRSMVRSMYTSEKVLVRLQHKLLRNPTHSEWANALPVELQGKLEEIRTSQLGGMSLSIVHTDPDGNEIAIDSLLHRSSMSAVDEVDAREERGVSEEFSSAIKQALTRLDDRQRELIYWRYLAPDGETITELELSEILGISESRVCQLEKETLATLRRYLRTCYRKEVEEELRKIAGL